jgi:DNA-binding beta-propeller fold protein YncE
MAALVAAALIGFGLWWTATDPAQIQPVDALHPDEAIAFDTTASNMRVFWPPNATDTELAVTGVAVGLDGSIYILHRTGRPFGAETELIPDPVILRVDADTGEEIARFGADLFASPHGISVAHDGSIWVADTSLNIVVHLDPRGQLIRRYGDRYPFYLEALLRVRNVLPRLHIPMSDATFARPTDVVPLSEGRFAVVDGYRNSRLAVFDTEGRLVWQVNRRGSDAGEFYLPHGIAADAQDNIYVADRRNARVQVFSARGQLQRVISGPYVGRPFGVDVDLRGCLFVADGGDMLDLDRQNALYRSGSGLSMFSADGVLIRRFDGLDQGQPGFQLPHDIAVGGDGRVYMADLYADQVYVVGLQTSCDG